METKELLFNTKLSQGFRVVVIILSLIALGAEVLPELEAKLIVIPALILAIFLSLYELIKHSRYYK
jgi:hypothetical protein